MVFLELKCTSILRIQQIFKVRIPKSEVRSRKSEIVSRKSEVGKRKSQVRSPKWGVGSQKSKVESRKSEVEIRKAQVGSKKSEVGSPSSAFVGKEIYSFLLQNVSSTFRNTKNLFPFVFKGANVSPKKGQLVNSRNKNLLQLKFLVNRSG